LRFNPSFDGNPEMGSKFSKAWILVRVRFNPSFDGNPEMGYLRRFRRFQPFGVSILLLMEIPKWDPRIIRNEKFEKRFNPSFDGNPEMGKAGTQPQITMVLVSILLLMEIPKWDQQAGLCFGPANGFQSFF